MSLGLNVLDIIFLIILFLSIMFGIIKGFIRELFSLAFFVIAVVLSFLFYSDVGKLYMSSLKSQDVANFAGFFTIFTIVLIVGSLVTYVTRKIFTIGPLKSIDMILGGVFGLLRGILISAIVVFALVSFPVDDNLIIKSRISPYLLKTIDVFFGLLPGNFQKQLKQAK